MVTTTILDVIYHGLLGVFATLGFAVWFNVPRDTLARVTLVGSLGYITRRVFIHLGHTPATACFWAALGIGLLGYEFARRKNEPRVIFTIPGIIPLVPGIPAYEALVAFFSGNISAGIENGVRASMILGALAAGLTGARALTMRRIPNAVEIHVRPASEAGTQVISPSR